MQKLKERLTNVMQTGILKKLNRRVNLFSSVDEVISKHCQTHQCCDTNNKSDVVARVLDAVGELDVVKELLKHVEEMEAVYDKEASMSDKEVEPKDREYYIAHSNAYSDVADRLRAILDGRK